MHKSILDFIKISSKRYSKHPVFVTRQKIRQKTISYLDLYTSVLKIGLFFDQHGIKNSDRILLWGGNTPEYATLLLGIFSFGRVGIPIDYRSDKENVLKVIQKTKPKYAFVSSYYASSFIVESGVQVFSFDIIEEYLNNISLTNANIQTLRQTDADLDQVCEIVFTSGSTGMPKGVMITQRNILTNLDSISNALVGFKTDTTVSILPLSHMFEQLIGLFLPIQFGCKIVYLPRVNSFKMLEAFKLYRPTHLIFVPQMLRIIWNRIEEKALLTGKFDRMKQALKFSKYFPQFILKMAFKDIYTIFGRRIKYIACGGAPLDANLASNWQNVGIPIIEGYGATEVTAVVSINPVNNVVPGTVGFPIDGCSITLDKDGQVVVQSNSVSKGYLEDTERTEQVFTPQGYKTGDIGSFDLGGRLVIKGRDAFKIVLPSGEKVYVEDIEAKFYLMTG